MPDLAEIIRLDGWWENPNAQREFARQWIRVPRRQEETPPAPAPAGCRPCPVPSAGRHVLLAGHVFTDDGRCWVPDER